MYKSLLEVKDSKIGKGVFTTVDIPANSPIISVTGNLYSLKELPDPNHIAIYQIGHDTFVGPSGEADDYMNHSCDPNCYLRIVGNKCTIFSLYDIPKCSELFFDYSTSSTDSHESWKIDCLCNSNKCRKVISGLQYLSQDIIDDYNIKGIIPLFLKDKKFL